MAASIKFSTLVAKIQNGDITESEFGQYFVEDRAKSKPFCPGLSINEGMVDISGVEAAARAASQELGIEASRTAKDNRIAAMAGAPKPDGSMIAEGDSWFSFPLQKTIIDWLKEKYPITNIAHPGDTLEEMLLAGEYNKHLATGKVKVLLFSGGGNDFLGDQFVKCLELFDPHHTDEKDAPYYLTPEFTRILDHCDGLYRFLCQHVANVSSKTTILVHGYDYLDPRCNGIFLGDRMTSRGLNPCHYPKLCRAIIKVMIDRFNEKLVNLQRIYPNFKYVKLTNTITPKEIYDEIHGKSAATKKLAAEVAKALVPAP